MQSIEEKIKLTGEAFNSQNIFPFKEALNDTINVDLFSKSFIAQPDLFVRIRPQNKKGAIEKIKASSNDYVLLDDDDCAAFSSGVNIENFLTAG